MLSSAFRGPSRPSSSSQSSETSPRASSAVASIATSSSQPLSSDISRELVCAICHNLFLEARTAECGHSFCRACICAWLAQNNTCPTCRSTIVTPPVKSVCLDRAIEVAVNNSNCPLMIAAYTERKRESEAQRSGECLCQARVQDLFKRARLSGVKLASISKVWSISEQERFVQGVSKHQGPSREVYCREVGLSLEWIAEAPYEQLIIAAANVRLPRTHPGDWKLACLRRRLEMFVRYG